ncbi:MerR family transcriptional regulator [Anaeromicrobium sediminis]|uniref:HTH merR-type domain-containing protein n=1 Tax=Anaeromicrobium sediminis TaxID=1478221 RepID=A0A267MJG3_9FIRM|nr:MerR family transcriptional regulator [Anaeromicrobium sediminis]PAB59058.1 hypothetical protein CCE28_12815 [Anaeromicrobium sediminis]
MKEYYLIGEVASIFNISTDTLRYYDKIGLLKPRKNEENNYRYYSREQFDLIYMILLLKGLDVSLEGIKDTLHRKDTSKLIDLLGTQEEKIQNKMEYLRALKESISDLKYQLTKLDDDINKISIKTCPKMWAVTVPWNGQEEDFDYNKILELNKGIDSEWTSVSRFTMITCKENFFQYGGTYRYGMISEYECKSKNVKLEYFPSRSCAFSIYKGDYSDIYSKYINMMSWIDKNGFNIAGDAVERSIINLCDGDHKSEYVAEIWIPIEEKNKK